MPETAAFGGLTAADYAVVGLYLLAVLGAGFWFAKLTKGGKDFFVGGNRIPWWAAGVSLYMTTFSAWMFTGAASFVYNTGWFGFLYFAVKPAGFVVGFLLAAVRWRRARITSPVEYIEERYNHTTRLVLSIVLVLSMMYWPGQHLASVAKISAPALFPGVPFAVDGLILFFGAFVLLYTVAGGIWAVSMTDVLQFIVLVSVCLVLLIAIFLSGDVNVAEAMAALPPLTFEHSFPGGHRLHALVRHRLRGGGHLWQRGRRQGPAVLYGARRNRRPQDGLAGDGAVPSLAVPVRASAAHRQGALARGGSARGLCRGLQTRRGHLHRGGAPVPSGGRGGAVHRGHDRGVHVGAR